MTKFVSNLVHIFGNCHTFFLPNLLHSRLPLASRNNDMKHFAQCYRLDFFPECPRTLRKYFIGKVFFTECFFGQKKALDKLRIAKKLKNNKNVLISSAIALPIALSIFTVFKIGFTCFMGGEIRTRNISLVCNLFYRSTPISLMSKLRFSFPCIITNRE